MWKQVSLSLLLYMIGAGVGSALQCDFLAPDYFLRSNAASDASACLQRGYTFSIRDSETLDTPLHLAVRNTDDPSLFEQLELLINSDEKQKLITLPNKDGLNPFLLAVVSNREPSIVVRLGRWGDVVDSTYETERNYLLETRGTTALHLAATPKADNTPSVEMITTLLAIRAKPNTEDAKGNRPYFYAKEATNSREMALLLDVDAWKAKIADAFDPEKFPEVLKDRAVISNACANFLSRDFFETAKVSDVWRCTISRANIRSDSLWSLRTQDLDNALHLALKANVDREKLNAMLAAADETGDLKAALSSEDRNGWSPIHIAADQSTDPLVIVALARWGADVNRIANARDNGFWKKKTGTTALHLAARRKDAEGFVTALLAMGADPSVYDNNSKDNKLDKPGGLMPVDYLNRSGNLNAMALIAPPFSFCKAVSENKEAVAALVGLGAGATGTAAAATTGLGITVVSHSSGALILTGSSGYIAGTLGTIGSTALGFLAAPATLTAAVVSVVVLGGTVYYCSGDE